MWDGERCPCDTFGLDRDNLPVKRHLRHRAATVSEVRVNG